MVFLCVPFFIIPGAPTTTGIVLISRCHIFSISISRLLYLLLSNSLAAVFLSDGTLMSINLQNFSVLCFSVMSSLFVWIALSVCAGKSHNIAILLLLSITGKVLCLYLFGSVAIL